MKKISWGVLLFTVWTLWVGIAGAQEKSLGNPALDRHGNKKVANPCPSEKPCEQSKGLPRRATETEEQYRAEILPLIASNRFDTLEEAAGRARSSKERVTGGTWKLYVFYDVVSTPAVGNRATERDWTDCLARLKRWVAARPQSITARVALAQAYFGFAWFARGSGFAGTVSESDWKVYSDRLDQASKALNEAQNLTAKCPQFYFVTQLLASAQGWPVEAQRKVFDRAIAFEPSYYHYYREFAYSLLPIWYGEEGDSEAFAEESARRIGGREGAFTYFELATVIYCQCGETAEHPTLSWPKIQEGFAVMEEEYGATTVKSNRFALLAYLFKDREVAKRALERVGENWDVSTWCKRSTFDQARAWAMPAAEKSPSPHAAATPPALDPRVVQWQADMAAAQKAGSSRQFEQAEELYRKALQEAEQIPPYSDPYQALPYTLQTFASFYMFQGNVPEAKKLFERQIQVCEQRGGKGSLQVQNARQNFATMYIMKRDYKPAEAIAKEMVKTAEHNSPEGNDPMLPQALDFLAGIYDSRGELKKAEPLYERALALEEKFQGRDSPLVVVGLDHLAAVYKMEGEFDKAEPLFRRQLELEEMQQGKSSPALLGALSQLADLMRKMGRQEEAAQFQQCYDAITKAQAHP
jgi:tetratricopeptide (TPR) repeat protein